MHTSFGVGLRALGANPLRTLLSTLGVIIGVGALVSILSMGDGVERLAREQVERTTDFQRVLVTPQTRRRLDDVWVPLEDPVRFESEDAERMRRIAGVRAATLLVTGGTATARHDSSDPPRGVRVLGMEPDGLRVLQFDSVDGSWPASRDEVLITRPLAAALGVSAGDSLTLDHRAWRIAAVAVAPPAEPSLLAAVLPVEAALRLLPETDPSTLPAIALRVGRIEDVQPVADSIRAWAASRFPGADRVAVSTNEHRVEQIGRAMLIFKLLMGAIAGISLVVGGIGIMNVLLSAVTERTREIGIRKAAGARYRDILAQFLTESVAVTGIGSALGLALGIATAHGVAWGMRIRTEAVVYPALTLGTVLVAVGASVVVGIVFGLYPALRAARLAPIDAIRHE